MRSRPLPRRWKVFDLIFVRCTLQYASDVKTVLPVINRASVVSQPPPTIREPKISPGGALAAGHGGEVGRAKPHCEAA